MTGFTDSSAAASHCCTAERLSYAIASQSAFWDSIEPAIGSARGKTTSVQQHYVGTRHRIIFTREGREREGGVPPRHPVHSPAGDWLRGLDGAPLRNAGGAGGNAAS